jgi:hypothetical protein
MGRIGGLRGEIGGWSVAATRRNTGFLRTINEKRLSGAGVALTLTLRDCPPTSDEWHRLRRAWIERMRRAGMIRLHWVTEWQRRGVPHLHGAIWFPDRYEMSIPVQAWCEVAGDYGAGMKGQHVRIIDGPIGWFQYLSKHAARGVKHYQRNSDSIPAEWQKKTGRVWGHVGEWPTMEPVRIELQDQHGDGGYFAFRRMVRSWRIADARAEKNAFRIRQARTMLKAPTIERSRITPVSEWIGAAGALQFLGNLVARGYEVTQAMRKDQDDNDARTPTENGAAATVEGEGRREAEDVD